MLKRLENYQCDAARRTAHVAFSICATAVSASCLCSQTTQACHAAKASHATPYVSAAIQTYQGLKWMGVVSCAVAIFCIPPLYFPMWGGMLMPAKSDATEEEYYYREYTPAEKEQGLHLASSAFVRTWLRSFTVLPCFPAALVRH